MFVKIRALMIYLIVAIATICIIFFTCWYFGLYFNSTTSFPIGIYQVDKKNVWEKGDLVLVCPPKTKQFKINYHDYLKSSNMCSTGTIGLLKKVMATDEDEVLVNNGLTKVNGVAVPNGEIKKYDHKKNKLYPCYGKHKIAPGMIWIMSDYNNKSFDSRYFCSVPAKNVIGKAKLLIEF